MRLIIVLLAAMLIGSCNFMTQQNDDPGADGSENIDMHNARNSLDYFGTYKGILPCGDCEGIETEIRLRPDSTFVRSAKYLGKDDPQLYYKSGKYEWNDEGNTISLLGIDPPNQFFVSENKLVQLDSEGRLIKGKLENKYALNKIP
jgi:uncharacterized lipoprotein NlpE involved in copper resistance